MTYYLILLLGIISPNVSNAQWTEYLHTSWDIETIAFSDTTIFLSTSYNGIKYSINEGYEWEEFPLNGQLFIYGDSLFVSNSDGFYLSTDNAESWISLIDSFRVISMCKYGSLLFCGGNKGLYSSSDDGSTWKYSETQGLNHAMVNSISGNGYEFYAGTQDWGLYLSENEGLDWTITSSPYFRNSIFSIQMIDSTLYVSSYGGVHKSIDKGKTWSTIDSGIENKAIYYLNKKAGMLYAASGAELYILMPEQESWMNISSGLPSNYGIIGIYFFNEYIYTIVGSSIWRRKLSEINIPLALDNNANVTSFQLEQNYPNPFNPITTIIYSISEVSNVSLIVYDVVGREVTTLVNEDKPIGKYKIDFNANYLSSGLYFYQLKTKNFNETKKMLLIK